MDLPANVYMCMAMAKSSRLFKKRKKELNSLNDIPCRTAHVTYTTVSRLAELNRQSYYLLFRNALGQFFQVLINVTNVCVAKQDPGEVQF